MPKQISTDELDAIVEAVAKFPNGAAVDEIRHLHKPTLPHRTLQRRLARLVDERRITTKGKGPSTRYHLPKNDVHIQPPTAKLALTAHPAHVKDYVPITSEAETIRQAVREPIQNRAPVSYNRAILDDYQPNVNYYLSTQNRHVLERTVAPWLLASN